MSFSSAIIVFPGTNRERDMAAALRQASGREPALLWHRETELPATDLIVLPGGFSYGDYLRSGAMASVSPIMNAVKAAADKGVAILGVCNGFQMLTEAGLLPGALLRNRDLRFICKWVHLRTETDRSPFTAQLKKAGTIRVPVAHHDGNYFADTQTLMRLEDDERIAFRYCDAEGGRSEDSNVNGSARAIAGILSENRRVLGLMPHPEDATAAHHGGRDGRGLFASLAGALA